jgi:3-hydroxybutyryl-CoA dehydrogenase
MNASLAIIGPGTLGRSLASWACQKGLEVRLAGRSPEHAQEARIAVEARWRRDVERGRLDQDTASQVQGRLHPCRSWEQALDGVDSVLEALPESLPLKIEAWARLDRLGAPEVLRLTGSSSIPLHRIHSGSRMSHPLLGFHLFLPLERMQVVELVSPPETDPSVIERAEQLAKRLQKRVVLVRDGAGYAASRMALAQGLEAMRILESGAASAADLDALMVMGYGHPVGPLELSDRIGLDLRLAIARGIFEESGDPAFKPPPILESLVEQGRLGIKTGQGFHTWPRRGTLP